MMTNMSDPARILAAMVCALFAALMTGNGALAAQSDWVEGFNNRVRLIGVAKAREGSKAAYMAGIEIEMSPGFKTYWRSPGDAGGVPPEFDWSGSDNLAGAKVLYPAPHRLIDKAGANIGYKDSVIFPVEITPEDTAKPVTLHLKAAYGICKNICIPAEAELELNVSGESEGSAELTAALARVPKTLDVADKSADAAGPVLASWRIEKSEGKTMLVLDVSGAGAEGDVFLFSDEGVYLPMTRKVNSAGEKTVFEADLDEAGDLKELAGKSIWVTMAGTKGQSETLIALPQDIAHP